MIAHKVSHRYRETHWTSIQHLSDFRLTLYSDARWVDLTIWYIILASFWASLYNLWGELESGPNFEQNQRSARTSSEVPGLWLLHSLVFKQNLCANQFVQPREKGRIVAPNNCMMKVVMPESRSAIQKSKLQVTWADLIRLDHKLLDECSLNACFLQSFPSWASSWSIRLEFVATQYGPGQSHVAARRTNIYKVILSYSSYSL